MKFKPTIGMMKGIIALDIDGTLVEESQLLSPEVARFLESLSAQGWHLVFITGRPFVWGYRVLHNLHIPYSFAVQNGALLLEMPARTVVSKTYLDRSILSAMEQICQIENTDFAIYMGYEYGDICYFRSDKWPVELVPYLEKRSRAFHETWIAVSDFESATIREFASVKCFAPREQAQRLTTAIEQALALHVPLIRDPFSESYYVVQATHPAVSKAHALEETARLTGLQEGIWIAAGDDNNDRSMLSIADIRVVMNTAPVDMRQTAHVVAPAARDRGIIAGLTEALSHVS